MNKGKDKPISESQLDRLSDILKEFHRENAMDLEQLDGFFAALHCEPSMTPPSRYLPEIWGGGEMSEDDAFKDDESVQEFMNLTMALWNDVGRRFEHKFFMPMFLKNEADNIVHGNNWAIGFMHGMDIHINDWLQLMHDEEESGILVPVMALAHEHDPDPELRSYKEPVSPEQREKLLRGVIAGTTLIYKYFAPQRIAYAKSQRQQSTVRHEQPKTGRNDACPCGSGLKYKKCCAKTVLH